MSYMYKNWSKKQLAEDIAGHATQLAYEYPDWDWEHIDAWQSCGPMSFDSDTMFDAASRATGYKNSGYTYQETVQKLTEEYSL